MSGSARSTRRGRDVAVFVSVAAVAVDALLLVVDLANGSPVAGVGGPFLDAWGLAKALLGAAGLALVAWWARSASWGAFAVIFTLVAIQDRLSWHGGVGRRMAQAFDLTWLTRLVPASPSAWGSFLVLLGVAVVGATAAYFAWLAHRSLRYPAAVLSGLLAALFVFAAVINLWGSARPDLPLGWVEELGESFVLSLALGYVSGLVARGPAWLLPAVRTGVAAPPS
jgi:hypothetical protein